MDFNVFIYGNYIYAVKRDFPLFKKKTFLQKKTRLRISQKENVYQYGQFPDIKIDFVPLFFFSLNSEPAPYHKQRSSLHNKFLKNTFYAPTVRLHCTFVIPHRTSALFILMRF